MERLQVQLSWPGSNKVSSGKDKFVLPETNNLRHFSPELLTHNVEQRYLTYGSTSKSLVLDYVASKRTNSEKQRTTK